MVHFWKVPGRNKKCISIRIYFKAKESLHLARGPRASALFDITHWVQRVRCRGHPATSCLTVWEEMCTFLPKRELFG